MKRVVVGCPIYNRAWILPRWFDSLAKQDGYDIIPALVYTKGTDDTVKIIEREKKRGRFKIILTEEHTGGTEAEDHDWSSPERVKTVADKRNKLIDLAIGADPDYFLSLDSDCLVPEGGIRSLEEVLSMKLKKGDPYSAVSPRVWIWDGAIACMTYEKGILTLVSRKSHGVSEVDVPSMSACLMTKKLLEDTAVRFGVFVEGEDFSWDPDRGVNGWSASEVFSWAAAAKKAAYRMALHANVTFAHEMKAPK
jgi:hypothetical protein